MKSLFGNELSGTLCRMSDTLNDRAAERLKEEKRKRGFSETELGQMLEWSQSKVAQKLSGRTPITLNELERICVVLTLSPTEVVRDRGLEFVADMTPLELRFLERVRQLPVEVRDALMQLIDIRQARLETRGATKSTFGKSQKGR